MTKKKTSAKKTVAQDDNKPYKIPAENYQGVELKRNPGIRQERMHAYTLPSRMGDWLHYPGTNKVVPFPAD